MNRDKPAIVNFLHDVGSRATSKIVSELVIALGVLACALVAPLASASIKEESYLTFVLWAITATLLTAFLVILFATRKALIKPAGQESGSDANDDTKALISIHRHIRQMKAHEQKFVMSHVKRHVTDALGRAKSASAKPVEFGLRDHVQLTANQLDCANVDYVFIERSVFANAEAAFSSRWKKFVIKKEPASFKGKRHYIFYLPTANAEDRFDELVRTTRFLHQHGFNVWFSPDKRDQPPTEITHPCSFHGCEVFDDHYAQTIHFQRPLGSVTYAEARSLLVGSHYLSEHGELRDLIRDIRDNATLIRDPTDESVASALGVATSIDIAMMDISRSTPAQYLSTAQRLPE